jgi:hypothetical protein
MSMLIFDVTTANAPEVNPSSESTCRFHRKPAEADPVPLLRADGCRCAGVRAACTFATKSSQDDEPSPLVLSRRRPGLIRARGVHWPRCETAAAAYRHRHCKYLSTLRSGRRCLALRVHLIEYLHLHLSG